MTAAVLLGVSLSARAQVPARDTPTTPLPTGAIRGRVLAADNGEPIRKARVDLVGGTGDRQDPVYADNEGRFLFAAVPPGRYALSAWKSGYVMTTFGARRPWEPAAMIAVDPGQTVEGINLVIGRGASISGRVLDDVGEPLADMQVTVGRAVPVN